MNASSLPLLAVAACLFACGSGAPPPAAPAEPPTTPTPSAAPSAPPSAAPVAAATATAAPSVEVVVPPPESPPALTAAPTAVEEALPPVSSEQKAFVTGQLLGTEVVFITVADAAATCASVASKGPAPKGARMAELRVLWKSGYYDFSNRMAQGKLSTYQGTFWLKEDATVGGVQVRAAPLQQGATGRIHVKASRPGSAQSMDAELDVTMCATIDFTKKGKG